MREIEIESFFLNQQRRGGGARYLFVYFTDKKMV